MPSLDGQLMPTSWPVLGMSTSNLRCLVKKEPSLSMEIEKNAQECEEGMQPMPSQLVRSRSLNFINPKLTRQTSRRSKGQLSILSRPSSSNQQTTPRSLILRQAIQPSSSPLGRVLTPNRKARSSNSSVRTGHLCMETL